MGLPAELPKAPEYLAPNGALAHQRPFPPYYLSLSSTSTTVPPSRKEQLRRGSAYVDHRPASDVRNTEWTTSSDAWMLRTARKDRAFYDRPAGPNPWDCPHCTFRNQDHARTVCGMCSLPPENVISQHRRGPSDSA